MISESNGEQNPGAEEKRVANALAERVRAILAPYQNREGAGGFPAIVAAEAGEIVEMSLSRREMAESIAAYRRRFEDQSALAMVIMDALVAAEGFRGQPTNLLSNTISRASKAFQTARRGGRPPLQLKRAIKVIGQIFPTGVPTDVSHAELGRRVNDRCSAMSLERLSRDTIIRARNSFSPE